MYRVTTMSLCSITRCKMKGCIIQNPTFLTVLLGSQITDHGSKIRQITDHGTKIRQITDHGQNIYLMTKNSTNLYFNVLWRP